MLEERQQARGRPRLDREERRLRRPEVQTDQRRVSGEPFHRAGGSGPCAARAGERVRWACPRARRRPLLHHGRVRDGAQAVLRGRSLMTRPPFGSPVWLPYFEGIVKTSERATEAAARMGYRGPGMIWYHMKRFGMAYPREWSRRPYAALFMRRNVPGVVIPTITGRRWVAGLVQGETC